MLRTCSPSACRELQDTGLVEQRELAPPATRTVYAATRAGLEVVPVLQALARFGAGLLGPADGAADVSPRMAVYAMVAPYHRPEPAGERFHARLQVDSETFDLVTDGPSLSLRRRIDETPDLDLDITARDLVAARQGSPLQPDSAEGERFARLFQLA